MSVGAIFSSAYKTTQIVEIVSLFARVKIIATVVRNDLLRESWFCERVMLGYAEVHIEYVLTWW